jgi:hypothetical protein
MFNHSTTHNAELSLPIQHKKFIKIWYIKIVQLQSYSQLSARVSDFITDKCWSIAQDLANMNPNMRLLMLQVNIPLEYKTNQLAWKGAGNGTPDLQRFILIQIGQMIFGES